MPWRAILAKEMADYLGVLAHPHRIRIVQELRSVELDVNSIQAILEISHSRVSQHLSVMRQSRIVVERRDGRHVFYRLRNSHVAQWLLEGMDLLDTNLDHDNQVHEAVQKSRSLWSEPQPFSSKS